MLSLMIIIRVGQPHSAEGKTGGVHVLVNDPTLGYGMIIENMTEAADKNDRGILLRCFCHFLFF